MKQMRSRFRLITLLLACAFLLATVLCVGNALKAANISLADLLALKPAGGNVSPSPSGSPELSPGPDYSLTPSESPLPENAFPGTDNSPVPEYNVFGL